MILKKILMMKLNNFLKYKKVAYKYWYDDSRNDDFYEVPFEAKRNELGIKPSYIEIWHPNSVIDEQVIKECVVLFCEDFLKISIEEVIFKSIVSIEEAIQEYIKECKLFSNGINIKFSESLISKLEEKWDKPQNEVVKILNKSIGNGN